jgi:uncharacterized protein with HEPN domain
MEADEARWSRSVTSTGSPSCLLLTEIIDAAEQAHQLADGITVSQLEADRRRQDTLLWNFTVLGEAVGQVSEDIKADRAAEGLGG